MQLGDAPAQLVKGVAGTAELFQVLGVRPSVGPGFRPGDDRNTAEPVAVLSHSLWRELGANPVHRRRADRAGRRQAHRRGGDAARLLVSRSHRARVARGAARSGGRERQLGADRPDAPGTRMDGMGPELARVMKLMHQQFDYPEGEWDKRANPTLTPLRDRLIGDIRPAVLATFAAMAVILLIASVNVAALMLGQVDSRGTELAVRSALGAGRRRLLIQLVVESLVIGAMAGVMGALMALAGFKFLAGALPLGALAEAATIDWGLLAAAIGIALAAATAVAMVPGFSVARSDLQSRLTRTRTGGVGGRGGRVESALVVAQVALVLLMVAGAGLLIRSVRNLRAIDPGVRVEGVAVLDVVMPSATEPARRPQVVRELLDAVRALPGVESAASTQKLPLRGSGDNWGLAIERQPQLEDATTAFRVVAPDYFRTMGIPCAAGAGCWPRTRTPRPPRARWSSTRRWPTSSSLGATRSGR
jgi:hypothetical protein